MSVPVTAGTPGSAPRYGSILSQSGRLAANMPLGALLTVIGLVGLCASIA